MIDSKHDVVVPHDDQAVEILRALIRGDHDGADTGLAEALDYPDLAEVVARLRACVLERGCLDPDTIRGVPDLIFHVAEHCGRLSAGAVRAFEVLGCVGHGCDVSRHGLQDQQGRPVRRLYKGEEITARFGREFELDPPLDATVHQVDGRIEDVTDHGLVLRLNDGGPWRVAATTVPWFAVLWICHYRGARPQRVGS